MKDLKQFKIFNLKNNQQLESILFCVCSVTENIKMS